MQEYNCQGSIDSSYGAGSYNTCTSQIGAPDAGVFQGFIANGALGIMLPIATIVILVSIAAVVVRFRKKRA